ncbi:MAG: deoxyguanosinetriphosphate triphosphohydrolase family protein [Anaerovoracaceae bacterium]|jgi:dGTPase
MPKNSFKDLAAGGGREDREKLTERFSAIPDRAGDIRSDFARDETRLLHCRAFRRLKHKTQVFPNIENDHICTRMEHVLHVASVAGTISDYLGLDTELTRAIALGHDIGHAPFGHEGEKLLNKLTQKKLSEPFRHESNGLRFADKIELLENFDGTFNNLGLTYAVRDGIVCHTGEEEYRPLRPRGELGDLEDIAADELAGSAEPATWEACVVKISDKIAYLGRDIEDAKALGFLDTAELAELKEMARQSGSGAINTTVIMHELIADICSCSDPDAGIRLSDKGAESMRELTDFNYSHIYNDSRLRPYSRFAHSVIAEVYNMLIQFYEGRETIDALRAVKSDYPVVVGEFIGSLRRLSAVDSPVEYRNNKIYGTLDTRETYIRAIVDFISGMTDRYAIRAYEELLKY